MTAYAAIGTYCALAALVGGASYRMPAWIGCVSGATVVVGLVGVDLVFFQAPETLVALVTDPNFIPIYLLPRLVVLSVVTAVPMGVGRLVGWSISKAGQS
jgi:hypothetical protein